MEANGVDTPIKRRIIDEIAESGPMPFERFMELALYDPEDGFFRTGPLRSVKSGDFLTSPEVSAAFGATLARHVTAEHTRLGHPDDFTLIEVGAGSGSLLEPLLEALEFQPRVIAVEASPAAREALTTRLRVGRGVGGSTTSVEVLADGEALPERFSGVVLANELLDNLPMALGVRTGGTWTERFVGVHEGALALVAVDPRPEAAAWLAAYAGEVDDGGIVEVQLAACAWLADMSARLEAGSIVAIDYGDTADLLEHRRPQGTLRTYRAHHLGPHPLDEPGATDITADVNFTALLAVGEEAGLECSLHRQDDFLTALGLRDDLARLRERELELAREGDTMERLAVRSQVTDVETILHPRGLGDFRVLACRR